MSARLLPKTTEEFSDAKFWEGFFKKRGSKAFEWYGEYADMVQLWAQYVKAGDKVLNVGCGNSELGAQLHDRQSCGRVVNIDTSETVVRQMAKKHTASGASLIYEVMDASKMAYEDCSFNCVVDKGTLDALMSASGTEATVDGMLAESHRILAAGGRHIVVSLCQHHIVDRLLRHAAAHAWIVRVHQVEQSGESAFPLPVFFVVFTKLRVPLPQPIVEVADGVSPPERLQQPAQQLREWIRAAQLASYSLKRQAQQAESQFAYSCRRTGLAALACQLVNNGRGAANGYAVFLSPLLSPAMDRRQRLEIVRKQRRARLLFVQLHPWLHYAGGDAGVQSLLSGLVMRFSPSATIAESEVPFLSTGRVCPYEEAPADAVRPPPPLLLERRADTGARRLLRAGSDLVDVLCAEGPDAGAERLGAVLRRLLPALVGSSGGGAAACVNCPVDLRLLSDCHLQLLALPAAPAAEDVDAARVAFADLLPPATDAQRPLRLCLYTPCCLSRQRHADGLRPPALAEAARLLDDGDDDACFLLVVRHLPMADAALLDAAAAWLAENFGCARRCSVEEPGDLGLGHSLVVCCRTAGSQRLADALADVSAEFGLQFC